MRPKSKYPVTGDLFQQPLAELINLKQGHRRHRAQGRSGGRHAQLAWQSLRWPTLPEAIEQVSILTAQKPKAVFVDKGYRGISVQGVTI